MLPVTPLSPRAVVAGRAAEIADRDVAGAGRVAGAGVPVGLSALSAATLPVTPLSPLPVFPVGLPRLAIAALPEPTVSPEPVSPVGLALFSAATLPLWRIAGALVPVGLASLSAAALPVRPVSPEPEPPVGLLRLSAASCRRRGCCRPSRIVRSGCEVEDTGFPSGAVISRTGFSSRATEVERRDIASRGLVAGAGVAGRAVGVTPALPSAS